MPMVYAWKTREKVSLTILKASRNRDYTQSYNSMIVLK